jgi:8-oxo-dGTP pyrophosphatase MutT (NUDIX family)
MSSHDVPRAIRRTLRNVSMPQVRRSAARVLLLDDAGRVLLFRGIDPHLPDVTFWFTPGGGVEPGEDLYEAARRELLEETGCTSVELGPPVWTRHNSFTFEGEMVSQFETFFVARVPSWQVDTTGFNELERRSILDHRWWTLAELRATSDVVHPGSLADLLAEVQA